MTTAALPLQAAIHDRLTGDPDLMALVADVVDEVPEKQHYPYVQLGDVTEIPDDTHDRPGVEATITLHIWSRYRGWKQALVILGHLDRILHRRPLDVDGFAVRSVVREWHKTTRDPDPTIRHIPVRFRVHLARED
ncbi:MAG TPA: DUF3168 domain-containing protein [Actinokineospora sp.]|jgi:hypothetical protein|nr:DUF3168 domain-containing protein [Actinokineospora sp.]